MTSSLSRYRHAPLAIAGVLMLLLLTLAHLQWRWIGEVSQVERHRRRMDLVMTGTRLVADVDGEVTRVFAAVHPELGLPAAKRLDEMARQLERWQAESVYPALIAGVYLMRMQASPPRPLVERLLPGERRTVAVPLPPELAGLPEHLHRPPGRRPTHLAGTRVLPSGAPVLLVPLAFPSRSPAGADDPLAGATLVVLLDRQTFASRILPQLAGAALRWRADDDVLLAVVDPGPRGRVIYRSDPAAPVQSRDADVCLSILGVRPLADLRALHEGHPHGLQGPSVDRPRVDCEEGGAAAEGAWQLLLRPRGRSIEAQVARLRRHNLAASLGILGLLAVTSVFLVFTAQRARRLARQQIDFVAGVTHELHTPLTAIRAAGENLADGVVADADQVRRYGLLIGDEGRRLSTLVAQLLELAGIEGGRQVYRLEPVDVAEVIDGALGECRWQLERAGMTVERDVPDGLPAVLADGGALRRGLHNLIENAAKYAREARWLRVRARATQAGVDIQVEDRGPGIRRDELPHLFEPFFRGRDAAAGATPGVGLGLALVRRIAEAHGGELGVASSTGGPRTGTTFTLRIPVARQVPPDPEADG